MLAYARGERTAVALNLTGEPRPLPVAGEIELSTHSGGGGRGLRPHEGVVLLLAGEVGRLQRAVGDPSAIDRSGPPGHAA